MTRKPIIGIPGWKVGDNSFGVTLPYMEFFEQYGIVKVLTLTEEVDNSIDLLVIPGGSDIDPLRYGAKPNFNNTRPDPIKEYFDVKILPQYIKANVPIFGICRGIQTIAVLFGGVLIQHLYNHESNDSLDRAKAVHNMIVTNHKLESELVNFKNGYNKGKGIKVNSLHHQCVSSKNLPDCLEVIATYVGKSNYVSIEAIKHSSLPIMAVQYHPEEMGFDVLSDYMIQSLISKSKNYA